MDSKNKHAWADLRFKIDEDAALCRMGHKDNLETQKPQYLTLLGNAGSAQMKISEINELIEQKLRDWRLGDDDSAFYKSEEPICLDIGIFPGNKKNVIGEQNLLGIKVEDYSSAIEKICARYESMGIEGVSVRAISLSALMFANFLIDSRGKYDKLFSDVTLKYPVLFIPTLTFGNIPLLKHIPGLKNKAYISEQIVRKKVDKALQKDPNATHFDTNSLLYKGMSTSLVQLALSEKVPKNIGEINIPVTIDMAREDHFNSPEKIREMVETNSQLKLIEREGGHMEEGKVIDNKG